MDLDDGWIVSIVLGSILVIVVVSFVIYAWFYRRKNYVSTFEDTPVAAHEISRMPHDKWDELLKTIEDDKRRETHQHKSRRSLKVG
jgi:hypothetical protein